MDLPCKTLQAELCISSRPALLFLPWETAWGGLESHLLWHRTYAGAGRDGIWQYPANKFLAGTQGSFLGENLLCVNVEGLRSVLIDLLLVPVSLPSMLSPVLEEVNNSLLMVSSFPEIPR